MILCMSHEAGSREGQLGVEQIETLNTYCISTKMILCISHEAGSREGELGAHTGVEQTEILKTNCIVAAAIRDQSNNSSPRNHNKLFLITNRWDS